MRLKTAIIAGLALFGTITQSSAQDAPIDEYILNLNEVDIQLLIDDVSTITGFGFAVHPDVQATVTVTSQDPLSADEVFRVFLSTLRVHGFAAVPSGRNFYSIEPVEVAVFNGTDQGRTDNSFVTELFRFDHFSAVEAAKMMQPLLSPLGQVIASPASNAVIAVEYGANIQRLRSLVGEIDIDQSVTKTVVLQAVSADEIVSVLMELSAESEAGGRGRAPLSAVAAEASNAIVLRGSQVQIERAEALIAELDVRSGLRRETAVIRLSHVDGASVLPILQEIARGSAAEEGPATASATNIALHEPSNSMIISATPETLASLARVAAELDVRRKQVLVEAIIVNVSDNLVRELGVQFLVAGSDGNVPFASTSLSEGGPNLLALTGALASDRFTGGLFEDGALQQAATSTLLGLSGGTLGFGTQSNGTLFSVVLNALKTDDRSNILSTPSIMVLNNETAVVSVGQEIPIVSGQVLGDANLNPFQTTERREIGVILNVTPHIGEDNTVRLDIDQEVSSIDMAIGTVTTDFVLNQSQVQTNVVANDGELIVLGGLIQRQDGLDVDKIPFLGDIPGVGRLFQNEEKSLETSNLMVFIRPTIISDADEAAQATARSYNYVRSQQILTNDGGPASIDQFWGEVFIGEDPLAEAKTDDAE